MATVVSSKGNNGFTIVLNSTDTPIMTENTPQSALANATEINGVTIAPVPVGKKLIITSICVTSDNTPSILCYNSPTSGTAAGTTIYKSTSASFGTGLYESVYWEFAAGQYFVVREDGGGGQAQIRCMGVLTDA